VELARTVLSMVLGIALTLALQLHDRRTLSPERTRPWNFATWGSALYAFGPLSMLGWSWVTRPRWRRCWYGPRQLLGLLLVIGAADAALGLALGGGPPRAEGRDTAAGSVVAEAALALALYVGLAAGGALLLLIMECAVSLRARLRARPRGRNARGAALALAASAAPAEPLEGHWLLRPTDHVPAHPAAHPYAPVPFGRDRALPPGEAGWAASGLGAVRGVTVGPIESALHPGVGYGTAAGRRALAEARRWGASWVALTPFGRVWDRRGVGVDLTFEKPVEDNTPAVLATIAEAHALGLRVLVVPHLWVESGEWRALVDPGDDDGWARWAASYRAFLLHWATVAELGGAEMLSVGVELRSWVTGRRAASFAALVREVRARYRGLLTYSGNWDDAAHTLIQGEIDVIGVNAFYPLAERAGADLGELLAGGRRVAAELASLARSWSKPVLLAEMGYTSRRDPAVRPWEWPDGMRDVVVDERAQAEAYQALLGAVYEAPWCAGFFLWRTYADPLDVSQEAAWGFSPRGKRAELVVRDAFAASWGADAPLAPLVVGAHRARTPGAGGWDPSP
jgi:hypothetical protein